MEKIYKIGLQHAKVLQNFYAKYWQKLSRIIFPFVDLLFYLREVILSYSWPLQSQP